MITDELIQLLAEKNLTLATAESCTGGNIAHALTLVPGASQVFKGGIVSYCDEVKHNILSVNSKDLDLFTAVSEPVALQMALGAKCAFNTDCAISTTGVAGPSGGTTDIPVGTVWMAVSTPTESQAFRFLFSGTRSDVINQATQQAIQLLIDALSKHLA